MPTTITVAVIMMYSLHPSPRFVCAHAPGNYLELETLAPALAQIMNMKKLDLSRKSWRTYSPGGVSWFNMKIRMRECVRVGC